MRALMRCWEPGGLWHALCHAMSGNGRFPACALLCDSGKLQLGIVTVWQRKCLQVFDMRGAIRELGGFLASWQHRSAKADTLKPRCPAILPWDSSDLALQSFVICTDMRGREPACFRHRSRTAARVLKTWRRDQANDMIPACDASRRLLHWNLQVFCTARQRT